MSSEKALYIIHCQDDLSCGMVDKGERFGGSVKRIGCYADHKAYLASTSDPNSPNYIRKIAAGPMETEDLKYMVGSFFIVESTREEAEAFNRNDPFSQNGVWKEVGCCSFTFCILQMLLSYLSHVRFQYIAG
jgi:uncharacterized protein YciI